MKKIEKSLAIGINELIIKTMLLIFSYSVIIIIISDCHIPRTGCKVNLNKFLTQPSITFI